MLLIVYLPPADPCFWSHLQQRGGQRDCDSLRDVCDGWEYLRHKHFVGKPEHVTFLLNTDGVSLFRSSSTSLWPIWLAVNELLPQVRYVGCLYAHPQCNTTMFCRFLRHNLLLAGLWYGEKSQQ